MSYIRISINTDEVIDEIDTDDLAAELIRRANWRSTLEASLRKAKQSGIPTDHEGIERDARELCDLARYGKPITNFLRSFADRHFGIII